MSTPIKRTTKIFAVLGATALIAAGCGSDDDSSSTTSSASKTDTTMEHSMGDDHAAADGKPTTISDVADTRATLGELLGEHSMLATLATTKGLTGAPDFDQAAAALTANGESLAEVIGSVYGDEARDAFLEGWNDHIGYLVDYTTAVAKDDNAARMKAVKDLDAYVQSFGEFLGTATDLPAKAVQDGLKAHVQHHTGIIDAYADEEYERAWEIERAAYEHMVMIGDTLSGAIAKQQDMDAGDSTASAMDTRIKLGSLLGEHTQLAYVATMKGLTGAPDFTAVAGALGSNSAELGELIGSVYGDDAKAAFDKQWEAHIGYLVDYTTATAEGDDAGQKAAVKKLDGYVEEFGSFLATATDLPKQAVKDGLDAHVQHHAGSINAYEDEKYEQAYELTHTGVEHMWMLGSTLAEAIVKQNPDEFSK